MKHVRAVAFTVLLVLVVAPVLAAIEADCPDLVRTALEATDRLCDGTGRNEACYGHVFLEAQPQPSVASFLFDQPGEQVDVASMKSLRLAPMQVDSGVWGVALMRLQANIAAAQPSDVTLLAFGDVQIDNAVETPTRVDITAGNTGVNIRQLPTTNAGVIGSLAPRQAAAALERLADNSWLRVELPESGETGWVNGSLVTSAGDLETLRVSEARRPFYRPMQAFYFNTGSADPGCADAPANGLLIQTPEGVGQVTFLINEVNIQLGSTVFFQAQPGGALTVSTLEGHAQVGVGDQVQVASAGMQVSVPLDENMVFVMISDEYEKALSSGKFTDIRVEQTLLYPNGQPGFYFVHLRYVEDIDAILEAEREARRQLEESQVTVEGQTARVRYSPLDMGDITLLFDGDPHSVARTLEANPFVVEVTFPQPRSLSGFSITIGSLEVKITARLYSNPGAEPVEYSSTYKGAVDHPETTLDFGRIVPVQIFYLEVQSIHESEPAHVHIWEITLK